MKATNIYRLCEDWIGFLATLDATTSNPRTSQALVEKPLEALRLVPPIGGSFQQMRPASTPPGSTLVAEAAQSKLSRTTT